MRHWTRAGMSAPLCRSGESIGEPLHTQPHQRSTEPGRDPVLVVHDQRPIAATVRALLGARGYTATVATEGAGALHLARRLEPAAIVLSLAALHPDGAAVAWHLRADPRLASIPMIGLAPRQCLRLPSAHLAVNALLWEPFSGDDLIAMMARWIQPRGPE